MPNTTHVRGTHAGNPHGRGRRDVTWAERMGIEGHVGEEHTSWKVALAICLAGGLFIVEAIVLAALGVC